MTSETGSVTVEWMNGTTSNALFSGSAPNQITLTICNDTAASITLPAGMVTLSTGSTYPVLGFYAGSLLEQDTWSGVACLTAGWQASVTTSGTLNLQLSGSVAVSAGGSQAVVVGGLVAAQPAGASSAVSIDLVYEDRIDPVYRPHPALCPIPLTIQIQSAPGPATLPALVGLVADQVTVGVPQTVRLFLTNQSGKPITWTGTAPTFTLAVQAGSGSADLIASDAEIGVTAEPGGLASWSVVPQKTSTGRAWQLRPSGGTLLGTGSQATAVFDIIGVNAVAPGTAAVALNYSGFSAYPDDAVAVAVEKLPVPPPLPQIVSFTATPDQLDLTTGADTVTLNYVVTGAMSVAILGVGVFVAEPSGTGSVTVPLSETATLTLVARDAAGNQASQSLMVTVSPSLFEMLPVGSIVMWNGAATGSYPDGWVACTAANPGAPDLADRFLVGAAQGQGLSTASATVHYHQTNSPGGITNKASNHVHGVGTVSYHSNGSVSTFIIHSTGTHSHTGKTGSIETSLDNTMGIKPASMALVYLLKQW